MSDVKRAETRPLASPLYLRDEELKQGVDLLFHAFSEVFSTGDGALRAAGLGRAHRRALYFIARNPALSVAALLGILKITKQSLNRVLNDLLEGGYVERRPAHEAIAPDCQRSRTRGKIVGGAAAAARARVPRGRTGCGRRIPPRTGGGFQCRPAAAQRRGQQESDPPRPGQP